MDGVLINSQGVLDDLEIEFLRDLTNNNWTDQDQTQIHGKTISEVYDLLVSRDKLLIPKRVFLQKYNDILNVTYNRQCRLTPNIVDFLNDIQAYGYKLAIASSTSHKYINIVLDKFNLRKYFQVVVSSDESRSKPEPDIFLLTANKLGVKPEECVVIEDSDNGIKAAKRAGMLCVQYAGRTTKSGLYVDLTVRSFRNLTIKEVLSKLDTIEYRLERITFNKKTYYFEVTDNVNKSDYYSDFLLKELIRFIERNGNNKTKLLEIGTGRGFIPIIIASIFSQIEKIVGIDIEGTAVALAKKNVWLNGLASIIEIRNGDLFSSLKKNEKFDFIIGAPPQIPVTKKYLRTLIRKHKEISPYHLTTSYGGKNGQVIIRRLIKNATKYLVPGGFLIEVQADFSFSDSLKCFIENCGFDLVKVARKQRLLENTSLTNKLEPFLNKNGYRFKKNIHNEKYFNLLAVFLKI